jgi:DegV family protein with EDD domain
MKERIGIVVDSTADFPAGMAAELGLHVVSIHIAVDGDDYRHGVTITNAEVMTALREDRSVDTSPPLPIEYADVFEQLLEDCDHVLSFHVSSALSNCFASAQGAIQLMFDDAAERVTPIDTRTCTAGQGQIVQRAVQLLQEGMARADLLHELDFLRSNSSLYFTGENLYWLKRAGRLNFVSSILGGMLDVKPVIGLHQGKLVPLTKDRGHEAALASVAQRTHEDYQRHNGECDIWIAHAAAQYKCDRLMAELRRILPAAVDRIRIAEVGPTIAAHAGPGCIALSVMPV